jgi:hypothetical protein
MFQSAQLLNHEAISLDFVMMKLGPTDDDDQCHHHHHHEVCSVHFFIDKSWSGVGLSALGTSTTIWTLMLALHDG